MYAGRAILEMAVCVVVEAKLHTREASLKG